MGIIRRLNPRSGFNPKTAARPQNKPRQIAQGEGGPAAQNQLSAPPEPLRNPLGVANFQRNRTNDAATLGLGNGRTANSANASGQRPMSDGQVLRGAGYDLRPGLSRYAVHDPARQSRQFGTRSPRGRQASEVTRGRYTTGRKLQPQMSDQDFLDGAALYRREHGGL